MGKLVATPAMVLKKRCLKALLLTSATLYQWQCDDTILRANCCCIRVFMLLEHLLSRMWYCGVIPVALILLRNIMYPLCILVSFLLFNGVTSFALLLIYTMTMMYLYPHWEWKGKQPVWSEYVLWFAQYILKYMSHAIFPWSVVPFVSWGGVALGLVERKLFRDLFICIFGVYYILG